MKITREKACQRLHHRVKTPLDIRIDGQFYSVVDWSMGGFRVAGWDRHDEGFKPTDTFPVYFKLPFQGFDIAFDVEVEMVRFDVSHQSAAFKFIELSERQVELLQHFIEQLVRGSMVPIGDTILRIDSPVTPVSTTPDPSPLEEVPVNRWPVKLIGMSVFYILLGLTLFSYLGITVYENILSLKVNTAITATPVEPLVSLVDGRIQKVNANLDQVVTKGQVLIEIDSPNLQKSIDEAKNKLELKKLELDSLRKRYQLAIEMSKNKNNKEIRLIQIDIDQMQQEITLATQDVLNLYEYKENLSIESPDDGRLVSLLRNHGSTIKSGETIGLFERSQLPRVNAFVTEEESKSLMINQQAQVYFPAMDNHVIARVLQIRPDKAFLSGDGYQYRPASDTNRSVLVELELLATEEVLEFNSIRSGMPVVVLFPASKLKRHLPQTIRTMFKSDDIEFDDIQDTSPVKQRDSNIGISI